MSVSLRALVKDYPGGHRVVDGVSLEVAQGELLTLLGPSGCGKTTTLRMIAGFEEPTAGEVWLSGTNVTRLPAHQRGAPLVFQSYALFPHLSVWENVAFGLVMRGERKDAARKKVEAMAGAAGLESLLDRSPNQLSGGQQQRVALLRALVLGPRVILFDEPLSNLDASLRASMRTEIRRQQRASGFTAIYVTHDQAEAMSVSDRVVVMNQGKVAQIGPPEELYRRPANRFVASFLGEASFVEGKVASQRAVETALGTLDLDAKGFGLGARVTVVVRPEAVTLGAGPLSGRVKTCTYLGADAAYELSVSGVTLTARGAGGRRFAEDSEVALSVDPTVLHLLEGSG